MSVIVIVFLPFLTSFVLAFFAGFFMAWLFFGYYLIAIA